MATTDTPKTKKAHKSKDSASKTSSSKKRRHDEEQAATAAAATAATPSLEATQAPATTAPSPSKKRRTDDTNDASEASSSTDRAQHIPTDSDLSTLSPFVQQTTSFYLPLAPVAHRFPLQGLCAEHISPLLLTYYPPLKGVLLSYTNPRLTSTPHNIPSSSSAPDAPAPSEPLAMAKSIDEYAVSFVWLTADFTVLRPAPGACIEGHVSLQNESYLGLVCWNFFNAAIDRKRLPSAWQWVGESSSGAAAANNSRGSADWLRGARSHAAESSQGYFVDGEGNKVEGMLRFRVRDFDSAPSTEKERGFLSIEGTLLAESDDRKVDAEERAKTKAKAKGRRLGGGRVVALPSHRQRPDPS